MTAVKAQEYRLIRCSIKSKAELLGGAGAWRIHGFGTSSTSVGGGGTLDIGLRGRRREKIPMEGRGRIWEIMGAHLRRRSSRWNTVGPHLGVWYNPAWEHPGRGIFGEERNWTRRTRGTGV